MYTDSEKYKILLIVVSNNLSPKGPQKVHKRYEMTYQGIYEAAIKM